MSVSFDLQRFAINNTTSYVKLTSRNYGETFTNSGFKVTIEGSWGDDTITDNGDSSSIDGGSGDDQILVNSQNSTANGGNGDDTIKARVANNVSLVGGNDDDCIVSDTSNNVTISAGNGDDTVIASGNNVSIDVGHGDDLVSLTGFGSGITVHGSIDDDTLVMDNYFGATYQYVGGNDVIKNWNSNGKISLSSGTYFTRETLQNDVVIKTANGTLTLINARNKTINIIGGRTSDTGSAGSDTPKNINNTSNNVTLTGSSKNDTITNSGSSVTINAGDGNDSITNSTGSKININTGAGADTVNIGYAQDLTIDAGAGNDSIRGYNNDAIIHAGEGNDAIVGGHANSKLYGDGGADLISITSYWQNTLDGGSGDDTLAVEGGSGHSLIGDAGADRISLGSASNSTVYYANGDGNDTVWSFNDTDRLNISGSYSTTKSGSDFRVNVGSGSILLKDYLKYGSININGKTISFGKDTTFTPQDVIKTFMKSLDQSTASNVTTMLNNAIKDASRNKYTSIEAVRTKMVNDCKSYNGDWNSFLKEKCDIVLDNSDTGAITGSDAGGSKTKTASSVVEETGSVDRNFKDNYFSYGGLNVYLEKTFTSLSSTEQYIWQGLRSWWLPGALKIINESYGENFSFGAQSSSTLTNKLYVRFYNDANNNALAGIPWPTINSQGVCTGDLTLEINMAYYSKIVEGNRDGKRSNSENFFLDRVLAHEFTHALMNANIKYATGSNGLPQFIKEGMAELTHGIDDERTENIKNYTGDYAALEANLDLEKMTHRTDDYNPAYVCGYAFLRYIAKQFSDYAGNDASDKSVANATSLPTGLTKSGTLIKATSAFKGKTINLAKYSGVKNVDATALSGAIEITGNNAENSIKSGKGNDKIFAGAGSDTINSGAGNDVLYGGSGDDILNGEAGNDSIHGGIGKNTLTGDAGKDLFAHEGGQDVITDYKAGEDKIQILSGSITKNSVSGKDIVFKTTGGSITVQGGAGQKITVIDVDGKETTKTYGSTPDTISGGKTLTVTKDVTLSSSYTNADASKRTTAVKITGNAQNNSIVGGTAADTLSGAAGNDTLTGGKGNDTFIYSTGKDVIMDYAAGDKISLGAAVSKATVSGSDVVFTIGSGSLTVKNAKGKSLSMIDKSGKAYSTVVGAASSNSTLKTVTNTDKSPVTIGAAVKTVDASKRTTAVKITGNAQNNSIVGGTAADTLSGAAGNDTLTGGKGNDTFIYSAGKDVIMDYAAGDKISLGAAVSKATVSGSDVVFTIGSGSLTVKDGKGKSLSMIDKSGKSYSTVVGAAGSASTLKTVTNTDKSPVTIGEAVKTVDASKRTTAVKITGNALNNSIVGGSKNDSLYGGTGNDSILGNAGNDKLYGEAGNDTLRGGAGNDSLWGGAGNDTLFGDAGNDTFIYSSGGGKDVICGFETGDLLSITGTFSGTYNKSAKTISIKVDSTANAITLKDFTATSFHINGDTYRISGTKLVK